MIKEHISLFRNLEIVTDISLVMAVGHLLYPFSAFSPSLVSIVVIWVGLLYWSGMYGSFRVKNMTDILLSVWSSALIGMGIFGSAAYLLQFEELHRFFVILIFGCSAVLISAEKAAIMLFFRNLRKKGYNSRNILIVGTNARAHKFMDLVKRHSEWGLKVVGLIDEDASLLGKTINGHKIIGMLKDVAEVVHDNVVDEVIMITPRSWNEKVEEIIIFCETEGIKVQYALDVFDVKFAKPRPTDLEGFQLLTFERAPIKVWHLFIKRIFDVCLSGILLAMLFPVFLVTAFAVKLTSPGPVFFKQTRCGLNSRKFTLYKFRTMVINAEELLAKLKAGNEMQGPAFKMKNDPRVTPVGKFLRKSSIDELPQLWNVFRGDMSIVGPRPPIPEEVKKYDNWQRRRLSMRPGITCLWQVQGRNNITDFNEWAKLDLEYIDQWSIIRDIQILIKTVPVVLLGIGAK